MGKKSIFWLWGIIAVLIFYSGARSQVLFQVTAEMASVYMYTWSPDGTQFAYVIPENNIYKLYRIDLDGSNRTSLADNFHSGYICTIDWKGAVIVFSVRVPGATEPYNTLLKRINPDGTNETTIIGPYWYGEQILSPGGNWLLFRDAPGGWWNANRCDLSGNKLKRVSDSPLVQGIGWFGKTHILYTRGNNYWTPCGLHKVNLYGGNHVQLTPNNLPKYAHFSGAPDTSKILYCDATFNNWDIWIMDPDGSNKIQLTTDPANDNLSWPLQHIWAPDCQSFYFVSNRTGNEDIYRMNIDGTGLNQITFSDSSDHTPIISPDGTKLAFLSNRDGVNNIWVLDFEPVEAVNVTIPDTSIENAGTIDLPIGISDVNQEIYSVSLTVQTDPAILLPQDVIIRSTLTEAWGKPTVIIHDGMIKFSMAGINPITAPGTLVYLRYQIPEPGVCNGITPITIAGCLFNEGQPPVSTHNGTFTLILKLNLSGTIAYYSSNFSVPVVAVSLDGHATVTDNAGAFQFDDIPCGHYTLAPGKPDEAAHAVNPYDAALILMADVGSITLTPYQKIAADVTGNGTVSAFDASYILRYYVGSISGFPTGQHWTFVPQGYTINQTNWHTAPDSIRYEPLAADQINQDFYGFVYGDVSGDWIEQSTTPEPGLAQVESQPQIVLEAIRKVEDEVYVLPIAIANGADIVSLGLTCGYRQEQFQFLGVSVRSDASPMVVSNDNDGKIKVGLASPNPINESRLSIELKFKGSALAAEEMRDSFWINEFSINGIRHTGYLSRIDDNAAATLPKEFILFQNYPNPFNPKTTISFGLPEPALVIINVFNLKGEMVTELFRGSKPAGYYSVTWDSSDNPSGIYFITMRVDNFVQTKRCVLLK